ILKSNFRYIKPHFRKKKDIFANSIYILFLNLNILSNMSGMYILIVLGLIFLFLCFFVVKQQTAVVIERLGKFHSVRFAGLQLKIPVIDKIAAKVSLKITQLDVVVETKTKDDVFVKIKVSVQYMV